MELGLAGKKALVTGSTKGIGRAIVESLLDEGVDVAICARNSEEVGKAIEDLEVETTYYDEVYELQFGQYFGKGNTRKAPPWEFEED